MALFVMIIRKMLQNKWLVFSLFVGIIMSVALVSSMPIYSEGILSRMLKKDLERSQTVTNQYPGSVYSSFTFPSNRPDRHLSMFDQVDRVMKNDAASGFQLPVQEQVTDLVSASLRFKVENDPDPKNKFSATFKSYSNLEQHIKLKDGRLPSKQPVEGVYGCL